MAWNVDVGIKYITPLKVFNQENLISLQNDVKLEI